MPYRHAPRPHARPPPRLTQLPVIRRWHMPPASAHAVSPHASTARTPLHRAPHSYPRYAGATCLTYRRMPYRHTPRPHLHAPPPRLTQLPAIRRCHMPHTSAHAVSPHASTARTPLHRAPHSYLRCAGATCHTRRRMTCRRTPRPHAHAPPPRPTQLPAIRRCHMPRASAHDVSPRASTARTSPPRPTQLPAIRRCHQRFLACSCAATAGQEALVARWIWHAPRAQIRGPRRAAAERDTANRDARCRARGRRVEAAGMDAWSPPRGAGPWPYAVGAPHLCAICLEGNCAR